MYATATHCLLSSVSYGTVGTGHTHTMCMGLPIHFPFSPYTYKLYGTELSTVNACTTIT